VTTAYERSLRNLSPDARRDLLRVLTSPSNVRADLIRQFHVRGVIWMVAPLTDLEADDPKRLQVIEVLRRVDAGEDSP
jgi:hypothetical protein